MHHRRVVCLSVLAAAAGAAAAQPVTYDFSGTLGDHFVPFIDDAEVISAQAAGVLRFDTGDAVTTTDPVDAYVHTTFTPSYTESWTASVEFDLPLVYDSNYTPSADTEQGMEVGLVALFTAGGTTFNALGPALEIYNPGTNFGPPERQYFCDVVTNDTPGDENWVPAAGVSTGTIQLSFDAATKVLTARTGDGTLILSADIDDPASDWGMTDTDTFQIGIYGGAYNRALLTSTPITLDNFAGEILAPVQPDETYAFDGVLGDHFIPFIDEPGVVSGQGSGVLAYHTNDAQIADATDAYASLNFAPRADQSWRASIDVTLPLAYDSYTPQVGLEQWIGMGIVALYDDGINPFSLAECTLEVWDGDLVEDVAGRYVQNDGVYHGFDVFGNAEDAAGIASGTLTLEYNATTRVISSLAEGLVIGTLDIDAPGNDWGMADSDTFAIGLYAGATNRSISASNPLTMDNFAGTILDNPEPTCPADLNGDTILDSGDIQTFIAFFLGGNTAVDLNGDGILDSGDIQTFIALFLAGC